MTYLPTFGSYDLPMTLYPVQEPAESAIAISRRARGHGASASAKRLTEKVIRMEGGLLQSAGTPLRAQIDDLKAGLQGSANLCLEVDRYWRNVQLRDFEVNYEGTGYGRMARLHLGFVSGDPYQYSKTTTTDSRAISATGQTKATTNSGNAPACPTLSLTVGGSGAVTLGCTVTNNTTGENFTLAGAVTGGDVIVVDCLEQTVTISGVDKTSLFDGVFPSLAVGSNTIQVDYSAGTITNLSLAHNARWY